MSYEYRARNADGNVVTGTLEAPSSEEAGQQLRRDGFTVLAIEDGDDSEAGLAIFARRVTKNEIVYVTNQLAIMVDTGISLSIALTAVSDQESNPSLKKVLKGLKASVESGEDFSAALQQYPRLFDQTYVSLVRASESMGTLGEMLERIADYVRKEVETRSKVRSALAYPMVMMLVASCVCIFLLTVILPKFKPLFSQKNIDLPKPTIIMMGASTLLNDYWMWWIPGLVALIVAIWFGLRTEPGRHFWDWAKINTPILGPMTRKAIISRSVRTLGTMLSGGVPTLDAIRLCGKITGNYFYERLWLEVEEKVTSGKRVNEALVGNPLFPPTLVQMISSGEETGKLGYVLVRVSDYYDRELENSVKTFTSLIEPIMITTMGVVVGGIGLGILLPIFKLSQSPG